MKIVKIGDFDKDGNPVGWQFGSVSDKICKGEAESKIDVVYCLGIFDFDNPNGAVTVNKVEVVEWTEKRRLAMTK